MSSADQLVVAANDRDGGLADADAGTDADGRYLVRFNQADLAFV